MKDKYIIVLEGPDASGKSELSKHIQQLSNGKCHTIHSNFDKTLPKENHRRQHKLIAKFINKQFSKKYYTGNNFVILDRSYFSDIVYGQIAYGSRGTLKQKFKYFDKLLKIMKKHNDTVKLFFVYCKPSVDSFDKQAKDELLTYKENNIVRDLYESTIDSHYFMEILFHNPIKFIQYDFNKDSKYNIFDFKLLGKDLNK